MADDSPYFRVYAWQEGRTLSKADIEDLCAVLREYGEELESNVNIWHETHQQVLREIGGEEFAAAYNTMAQAQITESITKAMARYHAKVEEIEARKRKQN
jgi:hypothetical protein